MYRLLKHEWIISRSSLLIGVVSYICVVLFVTYDTVINNSNDSIVMIPWISYMVAMSVMMRPMSIEYKDDTNKFLKLLPINCNYIVGAKFLFVNLVYIAILALSISWQNLLVAVSGIDFAFSLMGNIVDTSLSIILINIMIMGYYIWGYVNMQYVMVIGFLAAFAIFKNITPLFGESLSIVLLPITLIIMAISVILSGVFFRRRK